MTGADHESWVEPHVRIPMSDGVELDADLYLPAIDATTSGGRWPTLLWYDPYRKDDVPRVAKRTEIYLARRGFVVAVRIDVRGSGSATGTAADEYCEQELADGVEAIAWLARAAVVQRQRGDVRQLVRRLQQPPGRDAAAARAQGDRPMYFTDNRYTDDCHYKGGPADAVRPLGVRADHGGPKRPAADPEAVGDEWAPVWDDHLKAEPGCSTGSSIRHLTNTGSTARSARITGRSKPLRTCSVDGETGTNSNLRTFERCGAKKVIVGPWLHTLPDVGVPGPRIDLTHELARFFEYWLTGVDNGVMDEPPVTI